MQQTDYCVWQVDDLQLSTAPPRSLSYNLDTILYYRPPLSSNPKHSKNENSPKKQALGEPYAVHVRCTLLFTKPNVLGESWTGSCQSIDRSETMALVAAVTWAAREGVAISLWADSAMPSRTWSDLFQTPELPTT